VGARTDFPSRVCLAGATHSRGTTAEAETAVALGVAKGDGKTAVAARLGISYATVRSHLSRIFGKTAVGRQAELATLIAELAAQA